MLPQHLAASERVIVVEHNYRLGTLGFLALPVRCGSGPSIGIRPPKPNTPSPPPVSPCDVSPLHAEQRLK